MSTFRTVIDIAMRLVHEIFSFLFRSMLLVQVYFSYRNYLHVSLLYANIRKFSLRQVFFLLLINTVKLCCYRPQQVITIFLILTLN